MIDQDGIRARLRAALASLAREPERAADPEARLAEDLGYDSLRLIELSIVLEETFELHGISRERVANVTSVGQVESLVLQLLQERVEGGTPAS